MFLHSFSPCKTCVSLSTFYFKLLDIYCIIQTSHLTSLNLLFSPQKKFFCDFSFKAKPFQCLKFQIKPKAKKHLFQKLAVQKNVLALQTKENLQNFQLGPKQPYLAAKNTCVLFDDVLIHKEIVHLICLEKIIQWVILSNRSNLNESLNLKEKNIKLLSILKRRIL